MTTIGLLAELSVITLATYLGRVLAASLILAVTGLIAALRQHRSTDTGRHRATAPATMGTVTRLRTPRLRVTHPPLAA